MNTKRATLYTRVSTADQHPETHLYDLREMARQRGYEIVHEYNDTIGGGVKVFAGTVVALIGVTSGSASFARSLHLSAAAGAARIVLSAKIAARASSDRQYLAFVIGPSKSTDLSISPAFT